MPRPRRDGTLAAEPQKAKLREIFIKKLRPKAQPFVVWDTYQRGLALQVQPTGFKSWKAIYSFHGRPRWFHIGAADAIGLADARRLAARVMFQVAEGKDPAAQRKAERGRGSFEELATRYVEEYAQRKNKSWKQADALVRRHLIPKWGKLQADAVARADVQAMMARIKAPVVANQVLAAASAIFSWGIREGTVLVNPCLLVERNPTRSRERVLSDAEIPLFWSAFDTAGLVAGTALKVILLTGQRPGEVSCMRREHVVDGWWSLPGAPDPQLRWPGVKNAQTHRVWLPAAAQALIAEVSESKMVFANERGGAIAGLDAAMRTICAKLKVERATPHDLRRSFSTKVTGLGFGRDCMNRLMNHREGGIASVYDRFGYAEENKRVMEAVAAHIMALAEGRVAASNVIEARFER